LKQYHNIPPVYNRDSQILILGSFPSVKSREGAFFYHHPQNRFWKVLSALFHEPPLITIDEKKQFLLKHHIALWDVIESCEIKGSSDSSIDNVVINDLQKVLESSSIQYIYTNGKKAHSLYQKYCLSMTHIEDICLPSSSPANATYTLEKLIDSWQIILQNSTHIDLS
jgi:TDG/mug DNA glycosylase family protein